ncbi:exonuclease domain-containing protein [Flavobacterium sp. NKUCC04_CG]|uniref:exonuclease domain-containing protein n=1 Tax=Flavobacterium sp. NKUCC04_CG TaxID=2842121 RepID=UPI001C5AB4C7|nr:exonuclease domain-containing protein [Flavobacterium sp. NKUCC04_CG]MBW3519073.1 exonuclease [Flavobacterium sp. NKUCC04_CG]
MYAILDIETTGGQFNEEGITEIAIYRFDGTQVVDQFISLVNPEIEIQPFVVKLTGINNAMLRSAPKFYEVAKRILEITQDCVVVAHNAEFDYRILRTEFRRLGYDFRRPTLCTVELSKKLILEQQSYSLGKLVRSLGIPIADRHRANGDAIATLKLFQLLLSKDLEKNILTEMIKSDIKIGIAPKLLDIVEQLPSSTGIYYIHNQMGTIIFIGRSTNIKKKVSQNFTSNTALFKKIQKEAYTVTFEKTGNELIALLKESEEIAVNKPIYNKVSPKAIYPYSLYIKTNTAGFLYFSIEKTDGRKKNIMAFNSPSEGLKFTEKIILDHDLNPFIAQFNTKNNKKINSESFSEDSVEAFSQYNPRLLSAVQDYVLDDKNILLVDKGRKIEEKSAVVLEEGKLMGYCYYDLNYQITAKERLQSILIPLAFHRNHRNIILNYMNKRRGYKLLKF